MSLQSTTRNEDEVSTMNAHKLTENINSYLYSIEDNIVKNMDTLMQTILELENELKAGEYDYYRIVADLFTDIIDKLNQFSIYRGIPYVQMIEEKISLIEVEIRRQVELSFREIGQLADCDTELNPRLIDDTNDNENNLTQFKQINMQNLNQIYLIVDILGENFRRDLLEKFSLLQLIPYDKAFEFGTKFCGLEFLEKRFNWFRYLLQLLQSRFGSTFPRRWGVRQQMFIEFRRLTKLHMSDVLADTYRLQEKQKDRTKAGNNPEGVVSQYVNMLLIALKNILAFEAEITATLLVLASEDSDNAKLEVDCLINDEPISEVFDAYLGPYVTLERENLDIMMRKLNEVEARCSGKTGQSLNTVGSGVYDSSLQIFDYIKNSLKRCTAFSTGVTYLSLSREYRICLHNYAEILKFRCKLLVSLSAVFNSNMNLFIIQVHPQ